MLVVFKDLPLSLSNSVKRVEDWCSGSHTEGEGVINQVHALAPRVVVKLNTPENARLKSSSGNASKVGDCM
jgi:hypothetical protein